MDGIEHRKVQIRRASTVDLECGGIGSICRHALRSKGVGRNDANNRHERRHISDYNRDRLGFRIGTMVVDRSRRKRVSAGGHVRPNQTEHLFQAGRRRLNENDGLLSDLHTVGEEFDGLDPAVWVLSPHINLDIRRRREGFAALWLDNCQPGRLVGGFVVANEGHGLSRETHVISRHRRNRDFARRLGE